MEGSDVGLIIIGVVFGLWAGFGIMLLINIGDTTIQNNVLDDVCKQLTGNETAISTTVSYGNQLICELPSFDSTHSIIVRQAGEE